MLKSLMRPQRHTQSKKLLDDVWLKLMLSSDGEIEDQEIHAGRHLRTAALAQERVAQVKKDKGHQRQSQRKEKSRHQTHKQSESCYSAHHTGHQNHCPHPPVNLLLVEPR
ncbi:uncharacterized protein A4U43_C01F9510 [Asparagus officinalis]|uniref:Uncharacterized protein n=1 Tax=Asparagus officinalis TaxID=4686 RepID=A0A5P1FPU0_ASPOF|nr:uncharacterized protein A4U43_C01F9510 [Asparagus officinalis]